MKVTGWPTCAVCNKPVARLVECPSSGALFVVEAVCHGEAERLEISKIMFLNAKSISLDGVAFANSLKAKGL